MMTSTYNGSSSIGNPLLFMELGADLVGSAVQNGSG
jgi:hypothetical protein